HRASRLSPTVPEAGIVFDFIESRVASAELLTNAPDRGAYVPPIAIGPVTRNEPFAPHAVVEGAVGHMVPGPGGKMVNEVVLAQGEADILVIPERPAAIGVQVKPSQLDIRLRTVSRFAARLGVLAKQCRQNP